MYVALLQKVPQRTLFPGLLSIAIETVVPTPSKTAVSDTSDVPACNLVNEMRLRM
jgi:hypothetical protein